MNISMILDMAAETFGDRVGVVHGDQRWRYGAIRDAAQRAAQGVADRGVERLVLLDVSSPAVPVALFAAAYAGVPYVPLNYRLTSSEINALLARVTPALLVVGDAYADQVEARDGLQVPAVT